MSTDDKTPADRPAAASGTKAPAPASEIPDGPRALAREVQQLRDQVTQMQGHTARVDQLFALHTETGAQLAELLQTNSEMAAAIDRHADMLTAVNSFIEELAKVPAVRRGDGPARALPSVPTSGAVPGLELPAELQVDVSKPGTQITELPGGGILEINVRRPPANDAPKVIRNGEPVSPSKVRRS